MVVCSLEVLLTANLSWKPVRSPPLVICTLLSASMTRRGAGTGTPGPTNSVICTFLSIARRGDALRQSDADTLSGLGQLQGIDDTVGVADAPVLLRIAEVLGGDGVDALALFGAVLDQEREM